VQSGLSAAAKANVGSRTAPMSVNPRCRWLRRYDPKMAFPIRQQPALAPILLLFGVRPGNATVLLDGGRLMARFGFFRGETSLVNITRWDITEPYRWWRAVGVRRTFGTQDLSFGRSAHGGVCLHFREPILVGRFRVTDLYLTVDDLAGLGAALTAHGVPGQDLRHRR
jgi:hypothetical protein